VCDCTLPVDNGENRIAGIQVASQRTGRRAIEVNRLKFYPLAIVLCHFKSMSDEYTPTLQDIAADRDWWLRHSGAHYRELAAWLRGVAARCRLPNPQRELLALARRYERRADHFDRL